MQGAAGFIGRRLVQMLRKDGNKVFEIDPKISMKWPKKFDTVMALGAINGTDLFYSNPYTVARAGTTAILEAIEHALKAEACLIFTSSPEVYAGSTDLGVATIPTSEQIPLCLGDITNPRNSYAASKIIGEALVLGAVKEHDLGATILRLHGVYGPNDPNPHIIPALFKQLNSQKIVLKGWKNTRSFLYIDDCCKALRYFSLGTGQIYNIGSSEEISILDLAKKVCKVTGVECEIECEDAPEGSTLRRQPNISKAWKFGWEPEISLDDGLRKIWESKSWCEEK